MQDTLFIFGILLYGMQFKLILLVWGGDWTDRHIIMMILIWCLLRDAYIHEKHVGVKT